MGYSVKIKYLFDKGCRVGVVIEETGKPKRIVKGTPDELAKEIRACHNRAYHVS